MKTLDQKSTIKDTLVPNYLFLILVSVSITDCKEQNLVEGYPQGYTGIGVELRMDNGEPVVQRVHSNGPAAGAGILPGDQIVAINEEITKGLSFGDVITRIRGKKGTQLSLKLKRDGRTIWLLIPRGALHLKGGDYIPDDGNND